MAIGLDGAGFALAAAGATWAVVAGWGQAGSRPLAVVAAHLLAAGCFVAARRLHRRDPRLPAAVVVGVGALALTIGIATLFLAGGGPLGYANANATLFGLAALGAALMVTRVDRRHRVPATSFAVVFAAAVAITGSAAAMAALAAAVGVALVARGWAAPLAMAVLVAAIGLTAVLTLRDEAPPARIETRVELWREAHELLAAHPARGLGPGTFATASAAPRDADLRWAHNEYLEMGAEEGAIGLALLLALLGWAMLRCSATSGPDSGRAIGVASVLFVGLHASVDHVLQFWPITATTAFLVGATSVPATIRRHRARVARGILGSPLLRR
jgi:O-antigen ligase